MSLSDLHNPKAAADLIAKFRKRFSTKVCMAPQTDHEMPIVSAHTLSVGAMLRKIAVDGHVYALSSYGGVPNDSLPFEIQRRGLRDVSVFNGFCSKHDRELFSCLENEPFRFLPKQIFMLSYRAAARESYLKRKQAESLPTPEEYASMHGIDEPLGFSDEAISFIEASIRGAEDIESLKAKLDQYLITGDFNRLVTKAILFPNKPSVLASAVFQPFFDMDGNQLQDYENLHAEMSQIFISLIPIETGSAAIFSWLDTSNSAPRQFFESVLRGSNRTSSLLHAVLDNTENVAFSPLWYEALSDAQKEYVFSRIMTFESTLNYSGEVRPDDAAPYLDDWGAETVASF